MRSIIFILCAFVWQTVRAQDSYPRSEAIDIRHYQFTLALNDSTNQIAGETVLDLRLRKAVGSFELDFVNVNAAGQGMQVTGVWSENQVLKFTHEKDRLKIQFNGMAQAGEDKKITIHYTGIPQDGLIIGKNKFGDRTFFGDNWPNRAHHWLPTIDHPYDKATCEFIVTAPDHYTVIATGEKIEESSIGKNQKLTHWKTAVALPPKVMVIGVARFAVEYKAEVNGVSVQSWVYPQNRLAGFSDYAIAAKILDYFSHTIAPYPYEKLANVQSTTRYGGMENAGNIFYYENSVDGKGNHEGLIAHEIAHQWFGDSASEDDWYHVWLSEGLSTYFAHLYTENTYGNERLKEDMKNDRKQVIAYFQKQPSPVVNPSLTDLTKILNTNSYQKASWVLHMLRHEIGDQKFMEGMRAYYHQFQLSNAMTDDFRLVLEKVSGKDLKGFFDQWIFRSGHPVLNAHWTYDATKKNLRIIVEQMQKELFDFPLEVALQDETGKVQVEKVHISARKQEFLITHPKKPASLTLDPDVWLLFEGKVNPPTK